MATIQQSRSPERHENLDEDVGPSGERTEVLEQECSRTQREETEASEPSASPDTEPLAGVSRSPVREESTAEAAQATCVLADEPRKDEQPGCPQPESVEDTRAVEAIDNGDNAEQNTDTRKEQSGIGDNNASPKERNVEMGDDNISNAKEVDKDKEDSSVHHGRTEQLLDKPTGEVEKKDKCDVNNEETASRDNADMPAKQKPCRFVCKECGKRFTRRETYNLHRHVHSRKDDLAPLSCKECGLTFKQRSSLIKHRKEHKENEELPPSSKKRSGEEGMFQCAECQKIFFAVNKLRDHKCSTTAEKPYHCPLCRQEFQFRVSVSKHMMTHSQESIFSCQECSQTFPNTTALRIHQRCHSALKPYECPECGLVFKHYSIMEDHRRKHIDRTRSHLCNVCGKSFKYSSLLHQHQYLHTGQKPFQCPDCGKSFAFAQNMKAHCRQHRLQKSNNSSEQPCKKVPVPASTVVNGSGKANTRQIEKPKRAYKCPLCPLSFGVAANLRIHMSIHETEHEKRDKTPQPPSGISKHWDKGHACPHCPCVYRDESSLNIHLLSVHKPLAYLEKMSNQSDDLTLISSDNVRPKLKSDSVRPHKCSECDKSFRHRSVLDLHMRIHTKDKPYQCKECGKSFKFSSYLQQHVIIHTGKKPYKCTDCGKDFAFLQNMRSHQKLHQEKPFRCTSCRKGYSDETQLQHHMLSHNGDKPHKCNQCDKSFGLAYLLRDHMNTHTGERPHRCDECHKTFSWISSLLVHQKTHVRKRQGFSQFSSLQGGSRFGARGSRGRSGGRPIWGLSKPSLEPVNPQPPLYPASAHRDIGSVKSLVQQPSSMLSSHGDVKNIPLNDLEPHTKPVQWKVDSGEVMHVKSTEHQPGAPQQTQYDNPTQSGLESHYQKSPGRTDIPSISSASVQVSEFALGKETVSAVSSHTAPVSKIPSPSASIVSRSRHNMPVSWSINPTSSTQPSVSTTQHDFTLSSPYIDGAALWSIRPAALPNPHSSASNLCQEPQLPLWSSQNEPSTSSKDNPALDLGSPPVMSSTVDQTEKLRALGLVSASSSSQMEQSNALTISSPPGSHGIGSTLWNIQSPLTGIPKTINPPEKLVSSQDFQLLQQTQIPPGWVNVQAATQKVPISIQYDTHFGQAMGTPVWGFQNNAVSPRALLSGQLKSSIGQEQHQQPMVTGTQILINQASPFFSPQLAPLPPLALPGPHSLHSVAVSTLSRPPHPNLFFTPQAIMSERPHMPQALPLPPLATRTEPHKLGPRLPFASERLLQCMICGCSFSRELDLQMHYFQHAQGDI
ncbi:zinc finger protein 160 [Gouania willdenowi]|uniref:Zinc finger protein 160-like n=1 Tax=Gouania willdenowi TaxID=441366 RepID=A0A8C5E5W1_GOUWI|nr:zinc finger protein 160-like [Gouania willdenowi]